MPGILITQCLQNDFVLPIEKYDQLPNLLHIGYSESKRLMGEHIQTGPINSVMDWAYTIPEQDLAIIHIRDWHDSELKDQKAHLNQFGNHCIKDSPGAGFVFKDHINYNRKQHIINASGMNDFIDTDLATILLPYKGKTIAVGIIGVWTEAKIFFLCYELKTRYPEFDLAICSALSASSSRTGHFIALDQIKNILGVKVFSSIGAFTTFIANSMPDIDKYSNYEDSPTALNINSSTPLIKPDQNILHYLFRDCRHVELHCLDGGFSGNVVLKATSLDKLGHKQVPTVIKIGARDLIAQEREAFEKIQEVMGNNAPHIVEWAEVGDRGGIKYRYASMIDKNVTTFQDFYEQDGNDTLTRFYLDRVFLNQLGRLYEAGSEEKLDLLSYYDFQSKYAPHIRKNIEALPGVTIMADHITIDDNITIPNVCSFYEQELVAINPLFTETHFMAYLHGDLNGKNIIIDSQNNVWLIDFFHTHQGHILKDLIKLENDVLFIFTKINNSTEFIEAIRLTDVILNNKDLASPFNPHLESAFQSEKIKQAFSTIQILRSYYPGLIKWDRDPFQLHVGLLRYAMHTLSFDEANDYQKKWALYTGALCSRLVSEHLRHMRELKIDYIKTGDLSIPGKLAMTILPGRADKKRSLADDIIHIQKEGITHIVSLITIEEAVAFGVKDLFTKYQDANLEFYHLPIIDQTATTKELALPLFKWMHTALLNGNTVLIHCVGGLGRSGMIAAGYLKHNFSLTAEAAIHRVRQARSERAIETKEQEEFVNTL